jgi:hypothetical protein
MGWVYAIGPSPGSTVKIGHSATRTVKRRLTAMQVAHAERLVVLAKVRVRESRAVEGRIHSGLWPHRVRWSEDDFNGRREWFNRTLEVETFLEIMRTVTSEADLHRYIARLKGGVRCDRCGLPIRLTAPLTETTRCSGCIDAATLNSERLRVGRDAMRDRRAAKRAALQADGYLTLKQVSERIRVPLGRKWVQGEIEAGRLQAVSVHGDPTWWFRPEWVDAWGEALARLSAAERQRDSPVADPAVAGSSEVL